ncbi:MAG: MBL fold metallo-hydrolase [Bacteroidota bacterium]
MTIHLLGTGASVSDIDRTTTMLAFEEDGRFFLVDCGADATRELARAGLDPTQVAAVVLTHEHPDHISGYALLVEKLWLLGRREPIPFYGPESALRVARTCFTAFATDRWEGLPSRSHHVVDEREGVLVFEDETFRVTAAPVDHPVPTIGLRVETASGAIAAYSADTAHTDVVTRLATGASVLVHEATGHMPGVHASAEEAAQTAAEAGVDRLVLVHIPVGATDEGLTEARAIFPYTDWGTDGQAIYVGASEPPPREPISI